MSEDLFSRPQLRAMADGDGHENQLLLPGESQPTSLAMPNYKQPNQRFWPVPQASHHDDLSHASEGFLTYERAAGVDAIAHKLSLQHLRLDHQAAPPAPKASRPPSTLTTSYPPLVNTKLAVDPAHLDPLPTTETPNKIRSPITSAVGGSFREEDGDDSRQRPSVPQGDTRLQRTRSTKFHNTLQTTPAMRHLLESTTYTRTDRMVTHASRSAAPAHVQVRDSNEMDVDQCTNSISIEVDDDLDNAAEYEKSLVEQLMEVRHKSEVLGTRKLGIPMYRSSTETALRCQNLVKNKTRMRKRTKLKDKASQSAMSTAKGSPVATTSSTY